MAVTRSLASVALDAASAVAPPQSTAAAAGRGGILADRRILGRVAHVDGGIARGIGATVLGVLGVATVVGGGGGADGVGYGTIVGVATLVGTTMRRGSAIAAVVVVVVAGAVGVEAHAVRMMTCWGLHFPLLTLVAAADLAAELIRRHDITIVARHEFHGAHGAEA